MSLSSPASPPRRVGGAGLPRRPSPRPWLAELGGPLLLTRRRPSSLPRHGPPAAEERAATAGRGRGHGGAAGHARRPSGGGLQGSGQQDRGARRPRRRGQQAGEGGSPRRSLPWRLLLRPLPRPRRRASRGAGSGSAERAAAADPASARAGAGRGEQGGPAAAMGAGRTSGEAMGGGERGLGARAPAWRTGGAAGRAGHSGGRRRQQPHGGSMTRTRTGPTPRQPIPQLCTCAGSSARRPTLEFTARDTAPRCGLFFCKTDL